MLTQKKIFGLVKSMAGTNDVVAVNMSLVRFTGSWPAGLMLGQLLFWTDKGMLPNGWVCKTHAEWEGELMISEYQIRTATKHMATQMRIIETDFRKFGGTPKPHYRIKVEEFTSAFLEFLEGRNFQGSKNCTLKGKEGELSMEGEETAPSYTERDYLTQTTAANAQEQIPGPTKKSRKTNLKKPFTESQFFQIKFITEYFQGTDLAQVKWEYYLPKIQAWSEKKNVKRDEQGWRDTIETWIQKDINANCLRTVRDTKPGEGAVENPKTLKGEEYFDYYGGRNPNFIQPQQ